MAKMIKCDGCDRIKPEGSDITPHEFRPSPGLGQPKAIWKRDLCPACVRQIHDPMNWPRAESEAGNG